MENIKDKELFNVICCGMMRSGSTLQFNIVKDILDMKSISYVSRGFIDCLDFSSFGNHSTICKTHDLTLSDLIITDKFKFIYIYRDIRDVAVSLQIKLSLKDDQIMTYIDNIVENFYLIKNLPSQNIICQKYEEVLLDNHKAVKSIAEFLGQPMDSNQLNQIEALNTIENSSNRALEISQQPINQLKAILNKTRLFNYQIHDQENLLHHNHVSSNRGKTGMWQEQLSKDILGSIQDKHKQWLLMNGYALN